MSGGTLGVLLAGGHGRRLGLGPKAFVTLGGLTLLERARRTVLEVCDDVVVCAPDDLARRSPIPLDGVVHDRPEGSGPLAGLVAGLAARSFGRAVVLAVDFPLVTAALLEDFLGRLGAHDAVVARPGGVPQPLVAALGPGARALLQAAWEEGERSVAAALHRLDVRWLDGAELAALDPSGDSFLNVNTPADWERAARILAGRPPG